MYTHFDLDYENIISKTNLSDMTKSIHGKNDTTF